MEESPIDHVKAGKALYRNGWLVGFLVAAAISIAFLAFVRDVSDPFIELLLVGIPIGIAMGALAGLAVEGQALSQEMRSTIGLAIIMGFFLYIILLVSWLI